MSNDVVRKISSRKNIVLRYSSFANIIEKHRFDVDGNIIFRVDSRKSFEKSFVDEFDQVFCSEFDRDASDFDLAIISDYDKGSITKNIARKVIENIPIVIVDSKRKDLRIFDGAHTLNVNEIEYCSFVCSDQYLDFEKLFDFVVVTLGGRGAALRRFDRNSSTDHKAMIHVETIPADIVEPVDVTGCGDTHVAAFTLGLLRDRNDVRGAVRFANQCAAIAVQKFGTAEVSRWDFLKISKDG